MDKSLLDWAVQEFGYVPVDAHNPDALRKLCSGCLHPYWFYVVGHVKSEQETKRIKGNLKLFQRKLQQEPSKSSLSLTKFEDDTLSERDMLMKELKDIDFLSKKCQEKAAKVKAELSQGIKSHRTLAASLDDRENAVDAQFKHLTFLDSLLDSYANAGSGKLRHLAAAGQGLKSHLAGLRSGGEVKSKMPSFERLHRQCLEATRAATSVPAKPVTLPDPKVVAACVRECDHNPKIMVEMVTQKVRGLSQKAQSSGKSHPETASANTERVFEEWRAAHVTSLRKAAELEKEVAEQERSARMASDKAKRVLQETDASNEKRAAVLKLVCLNEKRARLGAALADLRSSLDSAGTPKNSREAQGMTARLTQIESLKSAIMNKQRTINILNERNSGFQQKMSTVQQGTRNLALKEVLALAREVTLELTSLNPALVANRLSNFKLSVGYSTLNVPSAPRHRFDSNAALFLQKLLEDKTDDFELAEFLRRASSFDNSKSNHESSFQTLLQHARTDPLTDVISQLNLVLKRMVSSK